MIEDENIFLKLYLFTRRPNKISRVFRIRGWRHASSSQPAFSRDKKLLRGSTILKSMTAVDYLLITSGLQVGFH